MLYQNTNKSHLTFSICIKNSKPLKMIIDCRTINQSLNDIFMIIRKKALEIWPWFRNEAKTYHFNSCLKTYYILTWLSNFMSEGDKKKKWGFRAWNLIYRGTHSNTMGMTIPKAQNLQSLFGPFVGEESEDHLNLPKSLKFVSIFLFVANVRQPYLSLHNRCLTLNH